MNIIYTDPYLHSEILLYSMKGFYLLHLPMGKRRLRLNKVIILNKALILLHEKMACIVRINHKVSALLKSQIDLIDNGKASVLGIVTQNTIENIDIGQVAFVRYERVIKLKSHLERKHILEIKKRLKELDDEKN